MVRRLYSIWYSVYSTRQPNQVLEGLLSFCDVDQVDDATVKHQGQRCARRAAELHIQGGLTFR